MGIPVEQIMDQVLLWCVTAAIGWIVGHVTALGRDERRKTAALAAGVRSLLRSELIRTHNGCHRQGGATLVDKEVAERVYSAYHDLGGNGLGTRLYEEIMAMPTVKDEGETK